MGKQNPKPGSVDALIAEWRAAGLDFSEGKTASLPEITPETKPQAVSGGVSEAIGEAMCGSTHPPRKSKYGAVKTEVDGVTFDSKKEARRYVELKAMEKAGGIRDLELQPKFELVVNGTKVGKYVADFQYIDYDGNVIVEDCKGMKTPVYRLKKKIVEAIYGITILET